MFARKINSDLFKLSEDLRRGWVERPREVHDLCHPRNPLVTWVKFSQYLLPRAKARCTWAYPWLISLNSVEDTQHGLGVVDRISFEFLEGLAENFPRRPAQVNAYNDNLTRAIINKNERLLKTWRAFVNLERYVIKKNLFFLKTSLTFVCIC